MNGSPLFGLGGNVLLVVILSLLFVEEAGVPLFFISGDLLLAVGGIAIASGQISPLVFIPAALLSMIAGALVGWEALRAIGVGSSLRYCSSVSRWRGSGSRSEAPAPWRLASCVCVPTDSRLEGLHHPGGCGQWNAAAHISHRVACRESGLHRSFRRSRRRSGSSGHQAHRPRRSQRCDPHPRSRHDRRAHCALARTRPAHGTHHGSMTGRVRSFCTPSLASLRLLALTIAPTMASSPTTGANA